jgi:hypothetical protein
MTKTRQYEIWQYLCANGKSDCPSISAHKGWSLKSTQNAMNCMVTQGNVLRHDIAGSRAAKFEAFTNNPPVEEVKFSNAGREKFPKHIERPELNYIVKLPLVNLEART